MARLVRQQPKPTVLPREREDPFVKARAEGMIIVENLGTYRPGITVRTPEEFLEADANIGKIRNARKLWALKMDPIIGPLERAIDHQKKALAAAKEAKQGADELNNEVLNLLQSREDAYKGAMRAFKLEEQRQLQAAEQERQAVARQLREEAAKKEFAAQAARTQQLRARLTQERVDLETRAEAVEMAEPTVIKGASSSARHQKKVRIKNYKAFLNAVQDYTPKAGVYTMGVPPLMVTNRKGEASPLVEVVQARLTELYAEQPGVVLSWPGVEEFEDITIAGR